MIDNIETKSTPIEVYTILKTRIIKKKWRNERLDMFKRYVVYR